MCYHRLNKKLISLLLIEFVKKCLNVDTYNVTYRYGGGGVILYDYTKTTDWDLVGEYAMKTVGVIVVASATYLVVQSGGALTPVLVPAVAKVIGG